MAWFPSGAGKLLYLPREHGPGERQPPRCQSSRDFALGAPQKQHPPDGPARPSRCRRLMSIPVKLFDNLRWVSRAAHGKRFWPADVFWIRLPFASHTCSESPTAHVTVPDQTVAPRSARDRLTLPRQPADRRGTLRKPPDGQEKRTRGMSPVLTRLAWCSNWQASRLAKNSHGFF